MVKDISRREDLEGRAATSGQAHIENQRLRIKILEMAILATATRPDTVPTDMAQQMYDWVKNIPPKSEGE